MNQMSKSGTLTGNLARDALYSWRHASLTRRGADQKILREHIRNLRQFEACVITARPVGFFSLFLGVVGQLYACRQAGVVPVVDFSEECLYWDESRPEGNVWEYYFEPVSDVALDQVNIKNALVSSRYLHGVIPERLVDAGRRQQISQLIQQMIRLKPEVERRIQERNEALTSGRRFISVHVRGTAKSEDLKYQYRGVLPLEFYWREIDHYTAEDSNLAIFLATDSDEVVHRFVKRYGDRIFTSSVKRSHEARGEIHLHGGNMQLGLEVLADCLLLQQGIALVHGVSNVSFAAAYWNYELEHVDVYQKYAWQSHLRWLHG